MASSTDWQTNQSDTVKSITYASYCVHGFRPSSYPESAAEQSVPCQTLFAKPIFSTPGYPSNDFTGLRRQTCWKSSPLNNSPVSRMTNMTWLAEPQFFEPSSSCYGLHAAESQNWSLWNLLASFRLQNLLGWIEQRADGDSIVRFDFTHWFLIIIRWIQLLSWFFISMNII